MEEHTPSTECCLLLSSVMQRWMPISFLLTMLGSLLMVAKLFFYHLLHLGYGLITVCAVLLSHCTSSLSFHCSSRKVKKLPHHLGLLFDSEDAIAHLSKVIQMLEQLAHMGLQHVSLYDIKGSLKSVLADALKSNPMLRLYSSNTGGFRLYIEAANCADKEDFYKYCTENEIPCERKGQLVVEVMCRRDGKDVIVKAARNLCIKALDALQSDGACPELKEDDIEESLRATGGIGPDPDLLLLFSDSRCLQGFPPWRLRLTEIQHVGPIKDFSKKVFFQAFDGFSRKEHRYGK